MRQLCYLTPLFAAAAFAVGIVAAPTAAAGLLNQRREHHLQSR